ncbi:MAG: outer membrane protein assembly factor BamA [Deltaproteobacteria bacterium]|nr:outer membrane protein assembly factor BamA [Deltaproteobacteria bacterium]
MGKSGRSGGFVNREGVKRVSRVFSWALFFMGALFCISPMANAQDPDKGTVAILPFQVNASRPLDHLRKGLQKMLSSRMAELGFEMVRPDRINQSPEAFSPVLETRDLVKLGKDLHARWMVRGTLTQIGEKASIDLKIMDVTLKRPPMFVFLVCEDVDRLSENIEPLAVRINDKILKVPIVDSLQVKGNRRIESAAVLAVVSTQPGDRLDYDRLDKDLREIYKMGFFKNVEMDTEDGPKGKIITFQVMEKPSIGKIVFEGNDEYDDDDLKKELGISLYSILDNNEVKQSVRRLQNFYREKGYYNAEIEEETEPIPNNEVMLKYKIQEHDKVYIEKIQFVGNKAFDDDELKDIMETSEKWFLSWITKAGVLDKKKLEFDVHKLASFYHNHGYIKAKVSDPEVRYDAELKGLVVTMDIVEGHQYGVDQVAVRGDLIEPAEALLKKVAIGKEKVFNREIVRKDILALRDVYADQGYAYAEIRPLVREDDENFTASVTYDISKGQKVRFERITISGNQVTRDKVIRRELKIVEGDYFSGKALKRSNENLNRLGFFEDVQLKTKKGSQEDLMNVDVEVKERGTRTFSVGAGYSSAYSAFVMFQIADQNFLGYGQKLEAAARIGGKNTEYSISFVEPWLFDKPLSLGVDLYKWKQEYDDYTRDSLGGAVNLGFPLKFIDDYSRGVVRYDYDDAKISDVTETQGPLHDMVGRNVTSSLTFRAKRDSRNDLWNPSRGSVNEISFQYAGGFLSGDEEFNKYRARTAWFFPLFWKTVFMAQGRWGYIQDRGHLSVYQKFFLGGINTMRGFKYESISPVDENGYKIGGTKMMCYNLEYRFPLLKEQGVVGLVFFDAGNVFEEDESWTFSGIRKSAGAGVRWYSPIGPLRLEYGFNLDPQGDEPSGRWEFSVGGGF